MRVGVINWDCSLPPNTFYGSYFAKTLSYKKWRYRTPYYADIISEDNICCHYRTQEECDIELEYAISAKIDYFAYVWHTQNREAKYNPEIPSSVTHPHGWTMDYVRKLHKTSKLNEKIKQCAILLSGYPYIEEDFISLAEDMNAPYYEKIGNRPLVYVYGGYNLKFIEKIKQFPEKYNSEEPYIVFMTEYGFKVNEESSNGYYSEAEAVTGYSCSPGPTHSYSQLIDAVIAENETRKECNIDVVPLFSLGWDPTPRIETKVPWVNYGLRAFAPYATKEELLEGAERMADWIKSNRDYTKSDHILTFSWNEFEEGAFICPTYNEDGSINDDRVSIFAQISDVFRKL